MTLEEQLLIRYQGKSVLLDSNLLLVFLSGTLGRGVFERFKRVSEYSFDDYELLVALLRSFKILLTTPHILTEVNSLANSLPTWYKQEWSENFAALIASEDESPGLSEKWIPAAELSAIPEFEKFGITDAAITRLSSEGLVITADYRLSEVLRARGVSVINFRDLRKLQIRLQRG
jgi:hypothetical protein